MKMLLPNLINAEVTFPTTTKNKQEGVQNGVDGDGLPTQQASLQHNVRSSAKTPLYYFQSIQFSI